MAAKKCSYRFLLLLCFIASAYTQLKNDKIIIPLGGNSWITQKATNGKEKVTNNGWQNWEHADAVWSTYIKLQKAGTIKLSAIIKVPAGKSSVKWSIGNDGKIINVSGATAKEYELGEWNIAAPGYIKIDAQGIKKSGDVFATLSDIAIEGSAVNDQTVFVKNNDDNYFYWGRRGASVHISYDVASINDDIECFYNEVTVPKGNDIIGSYFMANGFAEGYFGMQVNSSTERRILFSLWSPFNTDNPKDIPEDKKIILLQKGNKVHTGEFGNEGAGGQSYLKYNWKAGETYKFLIKAHPSTSNYTTYTAFFYDNENKKWMLIASFNRPATQTYLKRLHSFLENFDPENGNISRKAYYHNQWVKTKSGEWKPLNQMFLTADATAAKKYRMDYDGGVENGKFFMRNGGFFNESAVLKKNFMVEIPQQNPFANEREPNFFLENHQ